VAEWMLCRDLEGCDQNSSHDFLRCDAVQFRMLDSMASLSEKIVMLILLWEPWEPHNMDCCWRCLRYCRKLC